MKLACLRCKRKKIKCDKAEPVCHQCVTAKAECHYVERRQRPRVAQQRVATASLNQRLEELEKRLSNVGHHNLDSRQLNSRPTSLTISSPGVLDEEPATNAPSIVPSQVHENEESWVYQLASDTKRQFQSQTTPVSTPMPQIDTDMTALNEALEGLGRLRLRTDLTEQEVTLTIKPEEAKHCLELFFEMMDTLVVPDVFATTLDVNLLRSLPYIIGSPFVNVDPGLHVMYYAAIHFGLTQIHGRGHPLAQTAYVKALEHVPAWLESSTPTDMDGYTAALSAWVAINNLDYQLSWKFHLKSCHYLKSKGIDTLDMSPAKTFENEEKREPTRYLYWQILSTDCLFRLFWGKPTVLRWDPGKVRPPAVLSARNTHPDPFQVMAVCVWISYTSRTVEQINSMDKAHSQGLKVSHEVDECCRELDAIVTAWNLETVMRDTSVKFPIRCIVADHLMTINAAIVGLKRLANRLDKIDIVDALTIGAARKIVRVLLDVDQDGSFVQNKPAEETYFFHFINFYPFCAVFTLYEYVMACTNPDDCEEDVLQLERVGDAMEHSSKVFQSDLKPFTKTIKALNKVSRTIQDSRRNKRDSSPDQQPGGPIDTQQQPEDINMSTTLPDLDPMAFGTFPDFPMTMDGDPDPLGFVRAMENDFIGRNWNETWWDMGDGINSGMDTGLTFASGSAEPDQQQTSYSMPTPNT